MTMENIASNSRELRDDSPSASDSYITPSHDSIAAVRTIFANLCDHLTQAADDATIDRVLDRLKITPDLSFPCGPSCATDRAVAGATSKEPANPAFHVAYSKLADLKNSTAATIPGMKEDLHLGDCDDCLWAPIQGKVVSEASSNNLEVLVRPVVNFTAPVGENGKPLARSFLLATLATLYIAEDALADSSACLEREHINALMEHTFQGTFLKLAVSSKMIDLETYLDKNKYLSLPMIALQEGIITLSNTLSLFCAEKQPDFSTPYSLALAVMDQNLPTELARIAPSGVVGPLALNAKYIKGLTVVESGVPSIDVERAAAIAARKKAMLDDALEDGPLTSKGPFRHGCFAAGTVSGYRSAGISAVSTVFRRVLERLKINGLVADL